MKRFLMLLAVLVGSLVWAGTAGAAPGDSLATINPAAGCSGVGVAYDGTNILFTCFSDADVHKTDLTGANLGSVTITGAGGNTPGFDAIAYDPTETRLYGADLAQPGNCRIWSADLSTGVATLKFSYVDAGPLARCTAFVYDGLTVDTVTNTLYTSPDVNDTIHHFTKSGAPAGPDIPFTVLTAGQCPWAQGFGALGCWNSGLAIGLDGNLFAGTASDGLIKELNPLVPAVIGTFATVGGRDEDLECGPLFTKRDASMVETILSRDISGRIDVLEAPSGTCRSPVVKKADLSITKSGPAFAQSGGSITYVITVHNGGPADATNVTVNDPLPAGETLVSATPSQGTCSDNVSCSLGSIPNGGSATITIVATVTAASGSTICNTAEVSGDQPDPDTANNSSTTCAFVFAVPASGMFVIGDLNAAVGTSVTFWGAQWWKLNSLSDGAAPAAFKGFEDTPAAPGCTTSWTTDPGNSTPPPAGPLPAYMAVIVSSSISKSGSTISGNTLHLVIVKTNPGYDANPGHAGTGTVVAQICGGVAG